MSPVVEAPRDMIEAVADLRLPSGADALLQDLMDRNNEGQLTPREHTELAALAEISERISLVRAKALSLLGRKPA